MQALNLSFVYIRHKARDSCQTMFSKLRILTLYSQYIFSTLMFVVKHKDIITFNTELHKINTCHKGIYTFLH